MRAVKVICVTQVRDWEFSFKLNYVGKKLATSSTDDEFYVEPAGNALWLSDVLLSISAQAEIAWVQAHHIPHIVGDSLCFTREGGRRYVCLRQVEEKYFFFLSSVKMQVCLNRDVHESATGTGNTMKRSEYRGCSCTHDTTKVWGYK